MCEYKKYINISSFYVEIIGKCNLKCVYCYNDSTANSNAKIPLETIDKIIKYCKNNQIPIIEVSGGEPLLHEDFAQIMDHIYMSGRKARLVSNATFFPKQLHILEKYNPTIQTTLDGYNADINDKQRGEKSFEKILSGIECLLNSKYDGKLIVRHNISLNNRVYIREFVEFMYRLGIRNILFETINHMGRALENDGIIFDKGIFIKEYL